VSEGERSLQCIQLGCGDMPELAALLPHDRLGHAALLMLRREGITSQAQLESLTDADLLDFRGVGPKIVRLIRSRVPYQPARSIDLDCFLCRSNEAGRRLIWRDRRLEGLTAYVVFDNFPVTPGHVLIVPFRHVETPWDLMPAERADMDDLLHQAHKALTELYHPDGWNIGYNVGRAGGQTVDHVHLHLIPRYEGDVPDPEGGITKAGPPRVMYWIGRTGD
jgi:diadenosine tetraphosphate (Ap4A) HIT family hydrolase